MHPSPHPPMNPSSMDEYDKLDMIFLISVIFLFIGVTLSLIPLSINVHYELDMKKPARLNERLELYYHNISILLFLFHAIGMSLLTCAAGLLLLVTIAMWLRGDFGCVEKEGDGGNGGKGKVKGEVVAEKSGGKAEAPTRNSTPPLHHNSSLLPPSTHHPHYGSNDSNN